MSKAEKKCLEINQLTVKYDRNIILNDFNLELEEGKLYVILGPSGCGKSTLLSAISGLKTPSAGKISFLDKVFFDDIKGINIPTEKRNLGFVFQSYALWPHMTVFQNIAYPLKTRRTEKSEIINRVDNMLKYTGMEKYAKSYPNDLSGGEKQRVALIRALIYEPDFLLLDEPLSNLDTLLKMKLSHEIKEMQKKINVTTLYVTHDQNEAFEIADEILVMKEGKIMQKGSPQELYNHSSNSFVAEFVGRNNLLTKHDFHRYFFCKSRKNRCYEQKNNKEHKWISIRPEDVEMVKINEQWLRKLMDEDYYVGILSKVEFKGAITQYDIQYESTKLVAVSPRFYPVKLGDRITFTINRVSFIGE